jgi:hypothetical protein
MSYPTEGLPPWMRDAALHAAVTLHRELERINGLEMNDSQVAQDPDAGYFTWVREVSTIIEDAFRKAIEGRK